ncbi:MULTISPECIES: HIT family protein [Clostridium]|uniref:HIT family protein n=1 Tax=Clostridium TaxID=1485 RepID=UPI00069E062F|nr:MULTISPECIES: HIT family protein [Clostridium]KOF57582.1 HIT family hydrolase [Clostridium sp. DMHC 10]MCD2348914.1 HIT family protein [Clostridium guangxiense]
MECIFCNYDNENYIAENKYAFAILDKYPVNEGHTLIIAKRHFESLFEATPDEAKAIFSLIHEVKEILDVQYSPQGYNIGVNDGYAAGQTIRHLHVHVIPRYKGDVENPRGGIRNLKVSLINYD